MTKTNKPKSDCCQADVVVFGGDEGTYHWECTVCKQPCNVVQKVHKLSEVDHFRDTTKKVVETKSDWSKGGILQCECNKPYPNPEHGESCMNCGEEILEKGDEKMSEEQAMEEMECWSVQNHLKKCKKCAVQARQEGIEVAIEIKEIKTFQGRLSDCHNSLVIRVVYEDDGCRFFCERCGKSCGFYKIKQESELKKKNV